jgi:multiple sugar transport system permease protein
MPPPRSTKNRAKRLATYAALTLITAIILFPVFWMITTSFKIARDFLAIPPEWIFQPTLVHYEEISIARPFVTGYMVNSLIVALATTAVCIILGSLAAYAIARFEIRGKENLAFWVFSQRMIPAPAVALPLYILMQQLGLMDTYFGLVLMYLTFNLPFSIWILRGFYSEIPRELDEAATIDGCSRLGAFFRVVLPLSAPALVVTAMFCIVFSWNEFMFALVATATQAKTLPVAVQEFRGWHETEWGEVCAAGVVTILPLLLIAILFQRYLVRGLTLGAVKG